MPTTTGSAEDFITFSRASLATVIDFDGKVKWIGHNLVKNSESFDVTPWGISGASILSNIATAPNGTITADAVKANGLSALHYVQIVESTTYIPVNYTVGVFMKKDTNRYGWISSFDGTGTFGGVFDLESGVYVGNRTGSGTVSATINSIGNSWFYCTISFTPLAGTTLYPLAIGTNNNGDLGLSDASSGQIFVWGAHLYRSDLGGMQANTSAYPMYNSTTPKNRLGFTEDFTSSTWMKYRSTITSNAAVAPNGIQVADKLIPNSGQTQGAIFNSTILPIVSGSIYTATIYAKAAELGFVFFSLNARTSTAAQAVCVNLSTGAVSNQGAFGTYTVTDAGNGWWRISCTGTSNTTGAYVEAYPLAAAGTDTSYTGDGTSGIFIWGAQLSDSGSVDVYSPVYGAAITPAATYRPRLDFDQVTLSTKGLLIEEQRTNLLIRSAEMQDTNWIKSECSITANQITSPDGTATADLLTTTATTNPNIFQDVGAFTAGIPYTGSVWLRAGNTSIAILQIYRNGGGAVAPASSGVISGPGTIQVFSDLIIVSGLSATQWTRVFVTGTPASGGTLALYIKPRATGATIGDTIYVWGAQLEQGGFVTSYIPTISSQETRTLDSANISVGSIPYNSSEGTIVLNYQPAYDPTGTYRSHLKMVTAAPANRMQMRAYVSSGNLLSQVQVIDTTLQAEFNSANIVSPYINKIATALKTNDFAASFNGGTVQTDTSGTFASDVNSISFVGGAFDIGSGYIRQITYLPRRISNAELQTRAA